MASTIEMLVRERARKENIVSDIVSDIARDANCSSGGDI